MLNSATVIAAIDKFIEEILEGKEFSSSQLDPTPVLSIADALIKELEFRQLPPVDLLTFDGCPTKQFKFIENFKAREFTITFPLQIA